jgi:hypothetical protein
VFDLIYESIEDGILKNEVKFIGSKIEIVGVTKTGIEILCVIDFLIDELITAYPLVP